MNTIGELIRNFEPVSLEQIGAVQLMKRMDTKFVFHRSGLPGILDALVSSHRILEVGQVREQQYQSVYFDTPGLYCYLQHHNRRASRFKIRTRRYVDTGKSFFEIKSKSNRGITTKVRQKHYTSPDQITGEAGEMVRLHTGMDPDLFLPTRTVDFQRITLIDRDFSERITIDRNLAFSSNESKVGLPGLIIAEIKHERSGHRSLFQAELLKHHIRPFRVSKYCLGVFALDSGIKHNNFKEKFHYINKIGHDDC